MKFLRHWKMLLGLMAIFGAGVGTGGVGTFVVIYKMVTSPVSTQRWTNSRLSELESKLKLTPEQKTKIKPIVERTANRFREIGHEAFDKIFTTALQAHAEVAKELTPEQQVEFKKLRPQIISALRDLAQKEINSSSRSRREEPSGGLEQNIPSKMAPK